MRNETSLPHTDYTTQAFDDNRVQIDRVVIHSTVCTVQQAINTFSSPNAQTSAHYIVGNDGKLYSGLEEYFVAYHAGNYEMNQRSIGIEHEWYSGIHPSDALYKTSGALVRDICNYYNIPIDRTHIIKHNEVVPTACPNEIDIDRIIREAKGEAIVDDCSAKLAEKTALETELRNVIRSKDELLDKLNQQINDRNNDIVQLTNEKQVLADSNSQCQNRLTSVLEQAKKVTELTELTEAQEVKIQNLNTEITNYKKTIGAYKGRWELLKWSLKKLVIEKLIPLLT